MVAKKKKKAGRPKGKKKSSPKKAKQKSFVRTYGAEELVELLRRKHLEDVGISECKIGPSYGSGQATRRFDFWVMRKSWAHPSFIGYEVKVTRSDFLRDEKWREYLPFCSEFSFVCPPGIIAKEEVPEEAGLMVCSSNATVLYTKKKAPHRVIEIPESVLRYVLMSRVQVGRQWELGEDNVEKWKRWLKEKDEKKELGYNVSRKVSELVAEKITKAGTEVHRMEKEVEKFREVKKWLKANDIHLGSSWGITSTLNRRLEEHERGFTGRILSVLEDSEKKIREVVNLLRAEEHPRVRRDMGRLRMKDGEERPEVELGRTVLVPTVQVEKKGKS